MATKPSWDNWQEAYEEAAGHLCYIADNGGNEITDGEREAMYRIAARLRKHAARLNKPNKTNDLLRKLRAPLETIP